MNARIALRRPFNPLSGVWDIGAWELVGRVSYLKASDNVFAGGADRLADPTLFSNGATEMTLGYNWYINNWVRLQFNWEHAWFVRQVKLGPGPSGKQSRG